MKNVINQEVVQPESPKEKTPREVVVKLSPNPTKTEFIIDANGNLISSKNPREAHIVGKINLND